MDDDVIVDHALPWVAWMVYGAATPDAGDYTMNEVFMAGETGEDRASAAWEMLVVNLENKWRRGELPDFYFRKAAKAISAGTLGLAEFFDDRPVNDTWLHDYLLFPGLYYLEYDAYCSGIMLALLLLALYAGAEGLLSKRSPAARYPQPVLALLGIFLFLMAWESRERYFSNFFSILILAAVMGIHQLSERINCSRARGMIEQECLGHEKEGIC